METLVTDGRSCSGQTARRARDLVELVGERRQPHRELAAHSHLAGTGPRAIPEQAMMSVPEGAGELAKRRSLRASSSRGSGLHLPGCRQGTSERATILHMSTVPKVDPVSEAIANAPLDDRPETDEERKLIEEVRNDPNPVWIDGDEVSKKLAERARRERP